MPPRRRRPANEQDEDAPPVRRPRRVAAPAPLPVEAPPAAALHQTYDAHPMCYVPATVNLEEAEQQNKIYVSRRTYQQFADDDDSSLLAVELRPTGNEQTALVSIEGIHDGPQNVIYVPSPILARLSNPQTVNLLPVSEPLSAITKIELRILDNDFALEDPVEAIQDYLKDYYVLEEGVILNVLNYEMGIQVPIYVEKIHPEPRGRVVNGEVDLELLRVTEDEDMMPAPTAATAAVQPPPPPAETATPACHIPMLPGIMLPQFQPRSEPVMPTADERERMRQARLARFNM
jgi:hypothetical protein